MKVLFIIIILFSGALHAEDREQIHCDIYHYDKQTKHHEKIDELKVGAVGYGYYLERSMPINGFEDVSLGLKTENNSKRVRVLFFNNKKIIGSEVYAQAEASVAGESMALHAHQFDLLAICRLKNNKIY